MESGMDRLIRARLYGIVICCSTLFTAAAPGHTVNLEGLTIQHDAPDLHVLADAVAKEQLIDALGRTMGFEVRILTRPSEPLGKISGQWHGRSDRILAQIFRAYNLIIQYVDSTTPHSLAPENANRRIERVTVIGVGSESGLPPGTPPPPKPAVAGDRRAGTHRNITHSTVSELLQARAGATRNARVQAQPLSTADSQKTTGNVTGRAQATHRSFAEPGPETSAALQETTQRARRNLNQLLQALREAEASLKPPQ